MVGEQISLVSLAAEIWSPEIGIGKGAVVKFIPIKK